jgi:endonuclease G
MQKEERLDLLKKMWGQIAGDSNGDLEVMGGNSVETLELPDTRETETARRGARKLARNQDIDDDELDLFEAVVMPKYRPVVFIKGGIFEPIESPWTHLNDKAARNKFQSTFASIGRIELVNTPWTYGGTGFVVGRDLIMTNRHVAQIFAQGLGSRSISFRKGDAAIDFKREVDSPEDDRSAYLSVREVAMIHPYWDMALLRVDGLSKSQPALTLSSREPDAMVGSEVVVVGYPARDDRSDLALQDKIFKQKYQVKRLQPGKLRERAKVQSFGNEVFALTHDSSTLGGNSGSAVIDVTTGEVVALHFGGRYLKANYGVPSFELSRDSRVIDAGVNFDKKAKGPPNDWDAAWANTESTQGDKPTKPATIVVRSKPSQSRPPEITVPSNNNTNGAVTFTIPLQVTVSLGQPTIVGAPSPTITTPPSTPEVEAERPMQVPVIYPRLSTRKGYQPDFLEANVPLPTLTKKGKEIAATLEDESTELKYHHFSIVMHKKRRLALFTASNLDWRAESRLVDGRKPTRKELTGLPDNAAEQWVTDKRIPLEHQLPDEFYTKDGGAFDKGHLVRRDDACWGKSFNDMQKGNGDTYHTTNCSPQVALFNQSSKGEDNWGDLENMIQKETKTEKTIVFSGPVLADDDPIFTGVDDQGEVSIQIPRKFWKIVVAVVDGEPRAYGFVLEQDLSNVPTVEEFVVPQEWERYMQSISDIEGMLGGWVEFDWLKEHDGFQSTEALRMRRR